MILPNLAANGFYLPPIRPGSWLPLYLIFRPLFADTGRPQVHLQNPLVPPNHTGEGIIGSHVRTVLQILEYTQRAPCWYVLHVVFQ
ncbi:hypothetical protein I7I53_03306 [Histoplasma capsulatum var. duboisii H88]|uniref:Uncharacterized protein n=1 Tax=Ajellomyces capsulatus (strain H88) TaxID=544711 RepID=A0A8A1LTZ5_AJEC8|nr:hypothetical protein I7I53_03306 [Histoplasma capsulatum var. duboisii H88]